MKSVITSLRTWRIQLLLLVAVSLAACNPTKDAPVPTRYYGATRYCRRLSLHHDEWRGNESGHTLYPT